MSLKELPDSPFVGYLACENEIEVVEGTGELMCKSLRGAVVFKQVILSLFWRWLHSGSVVFIESSGPRFHALVRDRLDCGAGTGLLVGVLQKSSWNAVF